MEYIWKALLRGNLFGEKGKNRFTAIVSPRGKTLHNKDIADIIIAEGTEYKHETILDFLSRRDRVVREALGRGESVQDENFHFGPYIGGTLEGVDAKFDPLKNQIRIKARPTNKLRKLLLSIKVDIMGLMSPRSCIGRVLDLESGKSDNIITPNGDILITGINIQINPINDPEMGVFFTNRDTSEVFRVTHKLSVNMPSSIRARTPMLPGGNYELMIVTRYSGKKDVLLKTPRILRLGVKLTVASTSADTTWNPFVADTE